MVENCVSLDLIFIESISSRVTACSARSFHNFHNIDIISEDGAFSSTSFVYILYIQCARVFATQLLAEYSLFSSLPISRGTEKSSFSFRVKWTLYDLIIVSTQIEWNDSKVDRFFGRGSSHQSLKTQINNDKLPRCFTKKLSFVGTRARERVLF